MIFKNPYLTGSVIARRNYRNQTMQNDGLSGGQSRRDDTLLTGGFNRRKQQDTCSAKSRRDDT
jgi:hypothetical protein